MCVPLRPHGCSLLTRESWLRQGLSAASCACVHVGCAEQARRSLQELSQALAAVPPSPGGPRARAAAAAAAAAAWDGAGAAGERRAAGGARESAISAAAAAMPSVDYFSCVPDEVKVLALSFLGGDTARLCAMGRTCRWWRRLWPEVARSLSANDTLLATPARHTDSTLALGATRHGRLGGAQAPSPGEYLWRLIHRCSGMTSLNLSGCRTLVNVVHIPGATAEHVTSLSLRGCAQLRGVTALAACCPRLTELDCSSCRGLDLPALKVALSRCDALTSANLSGFRSLVALSDVFHVGEAATIAAVPGRRRTQLLLRRLHTLDLACCRCLNDISALLLHREPGGHQAAAAAAAAGLPCALRSLVLRKCRALASLAGLEGCPALTSLNLSDCRQLTSAELLRRLGACSASLRVLCLTSCLGVTDLECVRGCHALQRLDLGGCRELRSINALATIRPTLHSLNLKNCERLRDLGPLGDGGEGAGGGGGGGGGVSALHTLCISFCGSITSLAPLESCAALVALDASFAKGVREVSALARCRQLDKVVRADRQTDGRGWRSHELPVARSD
eukprot:COSAG01_NODE_6793_length_3495_cov_44.017668_2_plen_565_part_00